MNDEQKQAIDIAYRIENAVAECPAHIAIAAIAMVISAHIRAEDPSHISDLFDTLKRCAIAHQAHFANKEPANG